MLLKNQPSGTAGENGQDEIHTFILSVFFFVFFFANTKKINRELFQTGFQLKECFCLQTFCCFTSRNVQQMEVKPHGRAMQFNNWCVD